MKKLLVLFVVLFSITSCAYKNTLLREKAESFIYKDNAIEVFRNLGKNKYRDLLISEAKYQIGSQSNLGVAYKLMAMEYFDLAMHEYYEMGDKIDGEYFFLKAKAVAEAKYPFPENLNDWSINRKEYKDLKWAREDVLSSIYNGGFNKDPIDLAKAQVILDSWTELQSENFDVLGPKALQDEFNYRINRSFLFNAGDVTEEDIDALYTEFLQDNNSAYVKFRELRNIYDQFLIPELVEEPEEMIEEPEEIMEDSIVEDISDALEDTDALMDIESSISDVEESVMTINKVSEDEYSIYFDWNFTTPKDLDKEKAREIVNSFNSGDYNFIVIKAYTDRSGSDRINDVISAKRGEIVKSMLINLGVSEKVISVLALGEDNTPGLDGIRNPEYRKVIVDLIE